MAYGDSGSGSGAGGLSNKSVTFRGFSSRAQNRNYKLYDFEVAKQNLINRLSVRKGERVENPEFGTIIYDALFEPFTEDVKDAIIEDITANLNADPRISTQEIRVSEADKGIAIQATITYVPLNITEKLRFNFDENSLLRLS
jgi:phage baseplate assembly protein W|tara:strand:+ start:87 stop:512 length:426 start_codon:yes stop_codon:yes gene_type:complete